MESALPHRIGFFLIPEFPIYAVIPAAETLRIANQNSGRALFDWRFVSADERPVKSGSGMLVTPEAVLDHPPDLDTLIVCAGNQPMQHLDRRLLNWLRRLDRHGVRLGAATGCRTGESR